MSTLSLSSDPRPLRLWPAVALLTILWAFRFFLKLVEEPSAQLLMTAFFGPLVCALLILIWWAAASRATWREKVFGLVGFIALVVLGIFAGDPTIRGFGTLTAVQWGVSAFVVGLVASKWIRPRRRTVFGLAAAALALGYWTLVRMDGVWGGDYRAERSWRWSRTAEDDYLAARESRVAGASLDEPLTATEWPGFRGPGRDGLVPGVALAEDWQVRPPRELWRIPVGPGWSSFAVAGQLLLLPDAAQILVIGEKGDLVLVRATPERHEELTRFKVFNAKTWNHPVLVGDRLYLRNAEEAVALAMPLG